MVKDSIESRIDTIINRLIDIKYTFLNDLNDIRDNFKIPELVPPIDEIKYSIELINRKLNKNMLNIDEMRDNIDRFNIDFNRLNDYNDKI